MVAWQVMCLAHAKFTGHMLMEILLPNTARDLVLQVLDVVPPYALRERDHIDTHHIFFFWRRRQSGDQLPSMTQSIPVVFQEPRLRSDTQSIEACWIKATFHYTLPNTIPMRCLTMPAPCLYCHCFSLTSSLFIIPTMKSNASCYSYPPNANLSHATLSCRWSACP